MDTRSRNEERKRAIEAKRKRLEEIRRNKSAGTSSASVEASRKQEKSPATPVPVPREDAGLDKLVEELLNKPEQESSTTNDPADAGPQDAEISVPQVRERVKLKRQVELGMVNLARREVEAYHKEIQTEITLEELQDLESQAVGSQTQAKTSAAASTGTGSEEVGTESEEVGTGTSTSLPADKDLTSEGSNDDVNGNNEFTDLDDEERDDIENDELFTTFLKQGVRVIERAIKQNKTFDVTVDYGGLDESENAKQKEGLARVQTISDERWTTDRTVTEIQWSPHHKELFLTAHTKKQSSSELDWSRGSMDPGGVVCVWSVPMASERPEYVLTAQSPVHTAKFHPFASNLIIGGTYSGQIVIWDMRAKSLPVQHSLLSLKSHTHPVYSMSIVGTEHAHSLASISTDGKLCLWSLVNISQPTDTRMLKWKDSSSGSQSKLSNKREVTATTLAFPKGETNEFCIGTEDGSVYKAQVHGTNAGLLSRIEAHFGPVTQLDFNYKMNATSDLMLSCSMDWTVKLWSQRLSKFPLASFETSNDYMFGAKWSPVHPAVFVTISGSGAINVWNLNIDSEIPQATIDVGAGSCALSSLQWEPSGKRIMVGDTRGTVQIFELSSEFYSPRGDEAARLEITVAALVETAKENAPLPPYEQAWKA